MFHCRADNVNKIRVLVLYVVFVLTRRSWSCIGDSNQAGKE